MAVQPGLCQTRSETRMLVFSQRGSFYVNIKVAGWAGTTSKTICQSVSGLLIILLVLSCYSMVYMCSGQIPASKQVV